jgi:excisionase family DNA binding protein
MQKTRLLDNKLLFSRRDFSELTGLSLRTIAKLVALREVESIRVGRRRLIPKRALLRFIECNHSTQSAPRKKVGR